MTAINLQTVRHIAHLAKIALTETEEVKLEKDLSAVLDFVEKLKEVDTASVAPTTGGTTLTNAMRRDEQINKNLEGEQAGLCAAVPEKKDGWVKVKAVFS